MCGKCNKYRMCYERIPTILWALVMIMMILIYWHVVHTTYTNVYIKNLFFINKLRDKIRKHSRRLPSMSTSRMTTDRPRRSVSTWKDTMKEYTTERLYEIADDRGLTTEQCEGQWRLHMKNRYTQRIQRTWKIAEYRS